MMIRVQANFFLISVVIMLCNYDIDNNAHVTAADCLHIHMLQNCSVMSFDLKECLQQIVNKNHPQDTFELFSTSCANTAFMNQREKKNKEYYISNTTTAIDVLEDEPFRLSFEDSVAETGDDTFWWMSMMNATR